jgi:hypothetical protein
MLRANEYNYILCNNLISQKQVLENEIVLLRNEIENKSQELHDTHLHSNSLNDEINRLHTIYKNNLHDLQLEIVFLKTQLHELYDIKQNLVSLIDQIKQESRDSFHEMFKQLHSFFDKHQSHPQPPHQHQLQNPRPQLHPHQNPHPQPQPQPKPQYNKKSFGFIQNIN